ncbi:MAG TPA: acyl-CoA dehydrogenase family protein [Burkholderiales bacterium]|nr:acyl-CoA dehydrogenase family protein [Burkholderiales bacterium]
MSATPSAEHLVALAREMAPDLLARARQTEERRRIADDTARAFADAGFFRVLQPSRYGGLEMDYGTHTRLAVEIGRGCASSAWVLSVIASHSWLLGMFPPEAQDEVWAKDPEALVATSFLGVDPKAEPAPGGVALSGRWKFSSGVDLCRWAILMIPDARFALVPLALARIEDTWYASGLAGTGSNDIVVEELFVPAHRVVAIERLKGGPTPGSAVNPGYLYRMPVFGTFPFTLIGPALGAARGAFDAVAGGLAGRKSAAQVRLAEQQSVQLRLARVAAHIDAADATVLQLLEACVRDARAGAIPSLSERARCRLDLGFAAELCVRAMENLMPLTGGRGLLAGDPVQRAWRDVHAVAQHVALVWDVQAGLYGPVRLGLPCPDPKL